MRENIQEITTCMCGTMSAANSIQKCTIIGKVMLIASGTVHSGSSFENRRR